MCITDSDNLDWGDVVAQAIIVDYETLNTNYNVEYKAIIPTLKVLES